MQDTISIHNQEATAPQAFAVQGERRAHYRIYSAETLRPERAAIFLHTALSVEIEVINYSCAGLLFYADRGADLRPAQILPKIVLWFKNEPALEFSGQIVRAEEAGGRLFCALKFFDSLERSEEESFASGGMATRDISESMRQKWIATLLALPAYTQIADSDAQGAAQKAVYDFFRNKYPEFAPEEWWWFFEMLDELKRREPDYPPSLLNEFIRACEWGFGPLLDEFRRWRPRASLVRRLFARIRRILQRSGNGNPHAAS